MGFFSMMSKLARPFVSIGSKIAEGVGNVGKKIYSFFKPARVAFKEEVIEKGGRKPLIIPQYDIPASSSWSNIGRGVERIISDGGGLRQRVSLL